MTAACCRCTTTARVCLLAVARSTPRLPIRWCVGRCRGVQIGALWSGSALVMGWATPTRTMCGCGWMRGCRCMAAAAAVRCARECRGSCRPPALAASVPGGAPFRQRGDGCVLLAPVGGYGGLVCGLAGCAVWPGGSHQLPRCARYSAGVDVMGLGMNDLAPCGSPTAVRRHRALGEACTRCGVEGRHHRVLSLSEVVGRRRMWLARASAPQVGRRLHVVEDAL